MFIYRIHSDFFFFQAEDGIRDGHVTGVQTCALPILDGGLVHATTEGTPQGSPLSPLLSNVMLDDLDWELERRGHRFVRYADDGRIYVHSRRAGERVTASITQYVEQRLKLKVNREKSVVDRATKRPFLGLGFRYR